MAREAIGFALASAFVIALAWGALRLAGACTRLPAGRNLRVVEAVSLGRQRSACIVEAGGRWFLLGVADGGVSLIEELQVPFDAQGQAVGGSAAARGFLEALRGRFPGCRARPASEEKRTWTR